MNKSKYGMYSAMEDDETFTMVTLAAYSCEAVLGEQTYSDLKCYSSILSDLSNHNGGISAAPNHHGAVSQCAVPSYTQKRYQPYKVSQQARRGKENLARPSALPASSSISRQLLTPIQATSSVSSSEVTQDRTLTFPWCTPPYSPTDAECTVTWNLSPESSKTVCNDIQNYCASYDPLGVPSGIALDHNIQPVATQPRERDQETTNEFHFSIHETSRMDVIKTESGVVKKSIQEEPEKLPDQTHKKYQCPRCFRRFVFFEKFSVHVAGHVGKETCNICRRDFETVDLLIAHKESHRKHLCELCGVSFFRPRALREHIRLHDSSRPWQCGTCGNDYRHKRSLGRHLHQNPSHHPINRP